MNETDLPILLLIAFLFGLIGVAIGNRKGRPGAGFFFGLILGPLGWLIVAIGPKLNPDGTPATEPAKSPAMPDTKPADALLELKKLLDAGAITQAEYEAKKKGLIEKL